jgi:hypothetical protein
MLASLTRPASRQTGSKVGYLTTNYRIRKALGMGLKPAADVNKLCSAHELDLLLEPAPDSSSDWAISVL